MVENVRETGPPDPPPRPVPTQRPEAAAERGRPAESQRSAREDALAAARLEHAKATAPDTDRGGPVEGRYRSTASPAGERAAAHAAARRDAVAEARKAAQATDQGRRPAELDYRLTRPTGELGGTPDGKPTRIGPKEDDDARRSLMRENDSAIVLADKGGYQIQQNPSAAEVVQSRQSTGDTGRPGAKPDYLIEGRVFDCYAPLEDTDVRGIWSATGRKVERGQTQRVLLNLQDWQGSVSDLQRQFDAWPVDNLVEVKAITREGGIVQIVPNLDTDGERGTWGSSTS